MPIPARLALLTILALTVSPAVAHEFWIGLSNPTPAVGEIARVSLHIGEPFRGQPLRRDARLIRDFVHVGPNATASVVGRDGGHPAGLVRPEMEGTSIIAYRSRPMAIDHTAEAFNHYLAEDGQETIADLRAAAGRTNEPTREVYARYAKRLVRTPGGSAEGFDRVLGHTLELVPETDPIAASGPSQFRLLFNGEPVSGVKTVAISDADPETVHTFRTDADGRVTFDLDHHGDWIVAAVHMVAAGEDDDGAEWKSAWASLSFERAAEANPAVGMQSSP